MSSTDNSTTASNATSTDTSNPCVSANNAFGLLGLRVGALFIIMFTSLLGALFPVLSKRYNTIRVPKIAFEYVPCTPEFPYACILIAVITDLQSTLGLVSLSVNFL